MEGLDFGRSIVHPEYREAKSIINVEIRMVDAGGTRYNGGCNGKELALEGKA